MCGVAGIFLTGLDMASSPEAFPQDQLAALHRMGAAMAARGPDDESVSVVGPVALLHRRLSIVDPHPRANQPMQGRRWRISYNGEIYNFRAIRDEIGARFPFETESDSEVLLASLETFGLSGTLERIAGMFAFLAHDTQSDTLYAVRDPMGIKPLLMCKFTSGAYGFASSVTALRAAEESRHFAINADAIASFFVLGAVSSGETVFDGIERIAPAEYIKLDREGVLSRHRYWQPRYRENFTMDDLIDIVREYEYADVPSALFLSGGVDSTFLASIMPGLDGFHLSSPERDYAAAVAARFGNKFVEVSADATSYLEHMREVIAFHGEPMMSAGIPFAVSQAVAQAGYKMAISANGADELFLGYARTPAPEWVPGTLPQHERPPVALFTQQVAHIFRDSNRFALGKGSNDSDHQTGQVPSIRDLAMEATRLFHLPDFPASASHRWFELMSYVLHDLNPTLDAASMANSIEMRVPFLDHRIVEGVLSWDANRLIDPVLGRKAPLKSYLNRWFPAAFFQRDKLGFSISASSLNDVSRLGPQALDKYKNSGQISLNTAHRTDSSERDRIYLGASCLAHDIWADLFSSVKSAA